MTKSKAPKSPRRRTPARKRAETRGERNIRWIEEHCRVPEGRDVGKPIRLRPWQRKIVLGIYDNPRARTRYVIISFAKKNGKTAFAAMLLLLHLVGPEARVNSQLYSGAQSRDQAAVSFKLAAKMVRMSPDLNDVIIVRDSAKELVCPELGTEYKALSAEASTAHGKSPCFVIHDELGQVIGPRSDLYDALETADGAHDEPLSIIISTQAPNDGDLLSTLIDDALLNNPADTVLFLWTADVELDPFGEEAMRQANPALGDFLSLKSIKAKAEKAKRMPAAEATYRNFNLNQRISRTSPLVPATVWKACGGEPDDEILHTRSVYAGLDLSARHDLTAFVYGAQDESRLWHVRVKFYAPANGVRERAQRDRVPYDVWAEQGLLTLTPGSSVDYEFVAHDLAELADDLDFAAIAFDRWRMDVLRKELERLEIELPLVPFGQGFKSMSPALDELETALSNEQMRHGAHPILTMCAANAQATKDAAGNRKLDKAKSTGRIDGMVALAMMIGASIAPKTEKEEDPGESIYNQGRI